MTLLKATSSFIYNLKLQVRKWIPHLKSISVEPAALLMMTSVLMTYLLYQDLILDRICHVNLEYNPELCKGTVKMNKSMELQMQKLSAEIRAYRSIIDHSIPILFILFLGPWSDIYGRKLPLLLGTFGPFLQALLLLAFSYIDSVDAYTIALTTSILNALCGTNVGYTMAAYSYVSDRTDKSARTIRTGLLSAGYTLGVPMGFAIGGALTKAQFGAGPSFAISAGISSVAFFIILFSVENTPKTERNVTLNNGEVIQDQQSCWEILNPRRNIFEVFALPFKHRENSDRLKIWLLLLAYICISGPIHGEFGVMYLFLRERLGWDAGDYGMFSTFNSLIGVIGVIVSMGVLTYWLELSDPVVGFIAGISQFSGCFIYAFATTATTMYLAPTVDMMNGTMHVVARSMLSKIVLPDEIGKLFSLIAILGSVVPLAMDPTYSTIYRLTVEIFSGYFFILSAALTVPPQLIYLWFIWRNNRRKSNSLDITPKNGPNDKYEEEGVYNQTFKTDIESSRS